MDNLNEEQWKLKWKMRKLLNTLKMYSYNDDNSII